jgi:hypothetical protein
MSPPKPPGKPFFLKNLKKTRFSASGTDFPIPESHFPGSESQFPGPETRKIL